MTNNRQQADDIKGHCHCNSVCRPESVWEGRGEGVGGVEVVRTVTSRLGDHTVAVFVLRWKFV